MVWQSIEAVFVIFIMVGAGIFVSWKKWVTRDISKAFPMLVVNLTVPCVLIYNLATNFTRQQLFESWLPLLIVFIVVPITFLIGRLAARILKIPKTRRGLFTVLFSFSNSVFIGFPIAQALFGDAGMKYAIFYFLANTTFFFLLGFYAIIRDADAITGKHYKISTKEVVKKLISPPIVTILVMFIIILAGIELPDLILTSAHYIGAITTPLSLMFMGCMIYFIGLKGMKYEKGMLPILFGRYILIPAICFGACTLAISLFSPEGATSELLLMRNVFTVQIGLPVMIQTTITAELYGADVEYATKNVVWTTVASLVTIPAYMVLFQYI